MSWTYTTPLGIGYDELEGSPQVTMRRDGTVATRIFLVPDRSEVLFAKEMLNGTTLTWGGWVIYTPATYPTLAWVYADEVSWEPMDPGNPATLGIGHNQYPTAGIKVTVKYRSYDWTPGSGPDGNLKWTFRTTVGGEFLRHPQQGFKWNSDGAAIKTPDTMVAQVIPTIEHSLTFHGIKNPPLRTKVYPGVGTVNDQAYSWLFDSAAAGTLLFQGLDLSPRRDASGEMFFDMSYRFSERLVQGTNIGGGSIGWNHFYRPDKGAWDKLVDREGSGIGVYKESDFKDLFYRT